MNNGSHFTLPAALSRKEAAVYIGVSTRYLDQLAAKGELQRLKLGSKTIYLRDILDQFLKSKLQPVATKLETEHSEALAMEDLMRSKNR